MASTESLVDRIKKTRNPPKRITPTLTKSRFFVIINTFRNSERRKQMVLENLKGQSLRDHLVEFHAQDSTEVAKKDYSALEMFHFMQHDRMNQGWSVAKGTRPHTHHRMC